MNEIDSSDDIYMIPIPTIQTRVTKRDQGSIMERVVPVIVVPVKTNNDHATNMV